jgi:hypothetical protein
MRKNAPTTCSHAHSPPLGIWDASFTLGCRDRTGSRLALCSSSSFLSSITRCFCVLRNELKLAKEGLFLGYFDDSALYCEFKVAKDGWWVGLPKFVNS